MLEIASVFAESEVEDELQLDIIAIAAAAVMVTVVIFRKLIINSEGKASRRRCQIRSRMKPLNEHLALISVIYVSSTLFLKLVGAKAIQLGVSNEVSCQHTDRPECFRMKYESVSSAEFARMSGFEDWRCDFRGIQIQYIATSFAAIASFVDDINNAADALDHHPDITIRFPKIVHIALSTHVLGHLSNRDIELARAISAIAIIHSAKPQRVKSTHVNICIDTMDYKAIKPFWQAVLGYVEQDWDLVDPMRIGPEIWFQEMDVMRPERNRIHIDVHVPHDEAQSRIAAALGAGGTMINDAHARSWWVLADPEGNEACICTWQDRE